jgi:hypothetical protein
MTVVPERSYPAPARIRLMLVMADGTDYEVMLIPYAPPGVVTIRFVELQDDGEIEVVEIEVVEA